jgi:hypothetical protein
VARPRPVKKRPKAKPVQPPLPGMPPRDPPGTTRVLPMLLRIGDRLTDETGEYEIIGRPYTTNVGKDACVRVRRVGQPDVTEIRVWRAHERISVKRTSTEEGKR